MQAERGERVVKRPAHELFKLFLIEEFAEVLRDD